MTMRQTVMYDVRICKVYNLGTEDNLEILKADFVSQNASLRRF